MGLSGRGPCLKRGNATSDHVHVVVVVLPVVHNWSYSRLGVMIVVDDLPDEVIIIIEIKSHKTFDPRCWIRTLMGYDLKSLLVCSINMWGGARGDTSYHNRNPSHHFPRT
jgi:hypothetical protein